MSLLKLVLITLLASYIQTDSPFSYPIVKWSIGNLIIPNELIEFQLNIISPSQPGTYPLIVFLSGLDGMLPDFIYNDVLVELATQTNQIVIGLNKIRLPYLPTKEENVFEKTLNWTLNNFDLIFNNSENVPDSIKNMIRPLKENMTLISHSAGAHPIVAYLANKCAYVTKLILLDPVDGFDPYQIINIFITHPPKKLPFKIPTLIISTGLDDHSISSNSIPCAPTNMSNNRFYESLAGPTFYLNYTNYGHGDIIDSLYKPLINLACLSCSQSIYKDKCDFDTYKLNIVYALNYFIKAVNQQDSVYLNALKNPLKSGLFNSTIIDIQSKYNENGFDLTKTGPFCIHS